jgi:2-succinyl-5-enolpyruvyl-6-hydroxy-3-cyclohexene-1-carboxylate synthase
MDHPNATFCAALASNLATLGLRHVCISPGSRNTPLAAAFAAHPTITDWSIHDERSAGFVALGIAKAGGLPAAVISTSGTAAAEYTPAVIEADAAAVPLLVLTADRPPELRGVGAPQTIDQLGLYGGAVRWFHDAGVPDEATIAAVPGLAAHAWSTALRPPAGPVHLNLPFREPLADGPPGALPAATPLLMGAAASAPGDAELAGLADLVSGRRTLLVVGPTEEDGLAEACAALAAAGDFPLLADPLSGVRHGPHDRGHVVAHGDLLAGAGLLDRLAPEAIVRFGGLPTSKPIWQWMAAHPEIPQILVDRGRWRDATGSARVVVDGAAAPLASSLAGLVDPAEPSWWKAWHEADAAAGAALAAGLADLPFPNEPAVARSVVATLPPDAILMVGSSMPVRDVDTFGGSRATPLRILGNRGANGIDGTLSTALGAAAGNAPVTALVGDVAVVHDLNALATIARLAPRLTVVAIHNDGGGIFHFLPQRDPSVLAPEVFERHLATPHGLDLVAVAAATGLEARRIASSAELEAALATPPPAPRFLEIRTDRTANAEHHRRLRDLVAASVT